MIWYPNGHAKSTQFILKDSISIKPKAKIFTASLFHTEKGWIDTVVKAVPLQHNNKAVEQEIAHWRRLQHQNIVQLYCTLEYQGMVLFFMEEGTPLAL
jgi:serine/threonine protein kinase